MAVETVFKAEGMVVGCFAVFLPRMRQELLNT